MSLLTVIVRLFALLSDVAINSVTVVVQISGAHSHFIATSHSKWIM